MQQPIESEPPHIPEIQTEQERKRRNSSQKNLSKVVVGYTVLGLAAYGGADILENAVKGIYERVHTPTRPEQPIFPFDTSGKIPQEFETDLQNNLSRSLSAYSGWEESGIRLQRLLEKTQSPETVSALDRIGKNLLFEGTNTLQTAWLMGKIEDKVQISPENDSLWINNERYDLKNRFEMQLGSAWLQTKLSQLKTNLIIDQSLQQSGQTNIDLDEQQRQASAYAQELSLLTWLHKKSPPVVLEGESVAFFPRSEMVTLARITQAVDALGFGLPQTTWFQGTRYENRFGSGSVGHYNRFSDVINQKNSEFADTFAHEIGHWVSPKKDPLNRYRNLRGSSVQAPQSERLQYVTNYAMTNDREDFADTFRMYLMQGDYFRDLLNELQVHAPAAYTTLQKKYDFMHQTIFQGREFTKDAIPRVPVHEEMEKEFAGLSWSVRDHSFTVSPRPDALSGRRQFRHVYPIVVDNDIKEVAVSIATSAQRDVYSVTVDHPTLLNDAVLMPFPGNNRIQVNVVSFVEKGHSNGDIFKRRIEDGNTPTKVVPLGSSAAESVVLEVKSYSPIEEGQTRRIRDNDFKWTEKPVTFESDLNGNRYIVSLFDNSEVRIVGGPRSVWSERHQSHEAYWYIDTRMHNDTVTGWVSERWIGEVTQK